MIFLELFNSNRNISFLLPQKKYVEDFLRDKESFVISMMKFRCVYSISNQVILILGAIKWRSSLDLKSQYLQEINHHFYSMDAKWSNCLLMFFWMKGTTPRPCGEHVQERFKCAGEAQDTTAAVVQPWEEGLSQDTPRCKLAFTTHRTQKKAQSPLILWQNGF